MQSNQQRYYTLQRGNKTLSVIHQQRHYVVAFPNHTLARRVHYTLQPEPTLTLLRAPNEPIGTLFIPKLAPNTGSVWEPMNDGGFHMKEYKEHEALSIPFKKGLGLVIPVRLEEEEHAEYMFRAVVIDAYSTQP